jgi:tetratricopeptide (TPR) repeat protein
MNRQTFPRIILSLLLALVFLAAIGYTQKDRLAEALLCNQVSQVVKLQPPDLIDHLQRLLLGKVSPACAAYQLGLLAWNAGNWEAAETLWRQALQDPTYLGAVRSLAPQDTSLAQFAVQAFPGQAQTWDWAADTVPSGSPEPALSYLLRSSELQPRNNLTWEKIGSIAMTYDMPDLALKAVRNACDLYPIRNGNCLIAGRLSFLNGDWESTIRYYVDGFYPENPEGWSMLIRAAQKLGHERAARKYLAQAQQEYPADYETLLQMFP